MDLILACHEVGQHVRSIDISDLSLNELIEVHKSALNLVFNHHCPEVEKRITVIPSYAQFFFIQFHLCMVQHKRY